MSPDCHRRRAITKFSNQGTHVVNVEIVDRELPGFDVSTPEGLRMAIEKSIHKEVCPKFVRDAAEIVEGMLRK